MANKRFWLGMLVMVLTFGLTVVGCEEETEETGPKFQETITVSQIPGNKNGESFTMTLIKNSNPFASKEGIITNNNATATFTLDSIPDSVVLINNEYKCHLSLKIGNDPVKVSTLELGFRIADDGTYLGSQTNTYANLFE